MDWLNQIGGLLQQYSKRDASQPSQNAEQDFDHIARHAPQGAIADGLAESFRSQATPPFPQMLSQMFGNSAPDQKASILNMLIGSLGSGALGGMLSGGAGNVLGGLLGGGQHSVTPEQAQNVPPEAVQELAKHAEQKNPSVIDQISDFYAQQPGIVKTLGAAALTVALAQIGRKHKLL